MSVEAHAGKEEIGSMNIEKKLDELARRLRRTEETLGDINDDLSLLVECAREINREIPVKGRVPKTVVRRVAMVEQGLRRYAAQGVKRLTIKRHADGGATVAIGDYPEVELSATLADILECLARDAASEDGLVGYKNINELQLLMGKKRRRLFTRHGIVQLVSRLRAVLEKSGNNRFLVQTDLKRGYRFALRRGGACVVES
jgi:hypothetical protein